MTTRLRLVDIVTREHAETFAYEVVRRLNGDTELREAIDRTKIMAWPGEEDEAALDRYDAIEEAIIESILFLTTRAVADAFFMAANVILARERSR